MKPCCLHGDLWSGNIATADGQPSVFDPAVYFGHSEAEFGMSWCAGFSGDFWRAYRHVIPKAQGATSPVCPPRAASGLCRFHCQTAPLLEGSSRSGSRPAVPSKVRSSGWSHQCDTGSTAPRLYWVSDVSCSCVCVY